MKIGRVTLSDRASAGVYQDLSGPEIERVAAGCLPGPIEWFRRLIPDEQPLIEAALRDLADNQGCDLILTTGGTGPTPRDVTPEATRAVVHKELPGFGEMMRAVSFPTVPTAILSRATAGVRGETLIVNLPGSPQSISECLPPVVPAILKCLELLGPPRNSG